ncbi:hypothetical protein [Gluconobacter cerinus]|uniref:hypothetical protein n=1 Tax=Gluconobacter cerinus TaxID=38307 RepID=UPI001B8B44F7|nr:hypothetical protein [Gluconobacter cerinus]MBS1038092.1 hypothetical protein [Gluconobacter cerinus]
MKKHEIIYNLLKLELTIPLSSTSVLNGQRLGFFINSVERNARHFGYTDMLFYSLPTVKSKEHILTGQKILEILPRNTPDHRNESGNEILGGLIKFYSENYDIDLKYIGSYFPSKYCDAYTLGKDQKDHLKKIWSDIRPSNIKKRWWNNDYLRLLELLLNEDEYNVENEKSKAKKELGRLLKYPNSPLPDCP